MWQEPLLSPRPEVRRDRAGWAGLAGNRSSQEMGDLVQRPLKNILA